MSGDSDEEDTQTVGDLGVVKHRATSIFVQPNDADEDMRRHSVSGGERRYSASTTARKSNLFVRPIGWRGSVTIPLPKMAGSFPFINELRNLRNPLLCVATESQSCPHSPLTKNSEKQREVKDEMGIPTPSSCRSSTEEYSVLRWADRKRSVNCEEGPPSPSVQSRTLGDGRHKGGFIIGSVHVLSVCVAGRDVTRHVMEDINLRRNLKPGIVPASLVFSVHTVDSLLNRLSAPVQDEIFYSTKTPSCHDVAIRYMDPAGQMEIHSSRQTEPQQGPRLQQDPGPQQCSDLPRNSAVEEHQDATQNFSARKRTLALHVDTTRDECQHPRSSSRISTLQFSVSSGDHHIVLFTIGKLTKSRVLETCSWQGRDALGQMRRKVWAADGAILSRHLLDSLVGGSVDGPLVLGSQHKNKLTLSFPVLENHYIAKHLVVLRSDTEYRVHAVYPSPPRESRVSESLEPISPGSEYENATGVTMD